MNRKHVYFLSARDRSGKFSSKDRDVIYLSDNFLADTNTALAEIKNMIATYDPASTEMFFSQFDGKSSTKLRALANKIGFDYHEHDWFVETILKDEFYDIDEA